MKNTRTSVLNGSVIISLKDYPMALSIRPASTEPNWIVASFEDAIFIFDETAIEFLEEVTQKLRIVRTAKEAKDAGKENQMSPL
jgi:hypothetical protein